MFKTDASNETNSVPLRIEAYFYAAFHLIEAMAAKTAIHIEKHQKVRTMLEKSPQIFGDKTEQVWRAFHEIENQIRPGQIYGGQINGKKLERTIELFQIIENNCGNIK
ncbi:MAG: hypothetical protein HY754_01445 [Nitrospirae bacterium]|nr:hypothetical protein [Nitrospirota bacterium]